MEGTRTAARCFGLTDPGLVREKNEDALLTDAEAGLFVVADGMGGRNAGALASKLVVEGLAPLLRDKLGGVASRDDDAVVLRLREALIELSSGLYALSHGEPGMDGLGSTVVLAYLRGDAAWIANVGDSPCFLVRAGRLKKLTEDHNIASYLLARGEISYEQYLTHPARSMLSRYMGMRSGLEPDVRCQALERGDRLVLCSDGLTTMLPDDAIESRLRADVSPELGARDLVEAARAAGGRDNITVVIVEPAADDAHCPTV